MNISEKKILLADSSKFGRKSLVSVAAINDLDIGRLRRRGIEALRAEIITDITICIR